MATAKTGDLTFLPLAVASTLIKTRALSPVELVDAFLRKIERFDDRLHSYILVLADRARAEAKAAEAEIAAGGWRGPLHGIPYAVKDNYFTAGVRTCAASRLMLDHVPDHSAAAIVRLEAAGAILLGKLNTWEYGTGTGAVYFDLPFEPSRNPWNTDRFTGGSSSGAGAAVAGGLAMFALGSDTGGSIRLPAAACGVVGLKPTFGLVSRAGILPNCWSLDVAGPLTRTAEDAALVLSALAGFDAADPGSTEAPTTDYLAKLQHGVQGLKIGVLRHFGADGPTLSSAISDGVEQVISVLRQAGATIIELKPPASHGDYKNVSSMINWAESYSIHERDFLENRTQMGRALRDKLTIGFSIRAADYLAAQRQRRVLAKTTDVWLRDYDAVVTPCTNQVAPALANTEAVVAYTRDAFTSPFSVSGHPALALPSGVEADAMPVSVQIAARYFDEATLLRVATTYTRAMSWHLRQPHFASEPPK